MDINLTTSDPDNGPVYPVIEIDNGMNYIGIHVLPDERVWITMPGLDLTPVVINMSEMTTEINSKGSVSTTPGNMSIMLWSKQDNEDEYTHREVYADWSNLEEED